MKLSILAPLSALLIAGSIALPTLVPTATQVPLSQDPSPPRPFPAGRIVEVKDPSPPRPFPKYALVAGNPLEARDPSALSRFPTDEESVVHDPSPPRPFPAGRIVEAKNPAAPPLEERDPSAPHKLVEFHNTATTDPSPPRPFPKYPPDGATPLEERDPLSRFPSDEENEAADPSPPRPFPAGHPVSILPRLQPPPPHRGHGGYFPPPNPPAADPTAVAARNTPCPHSCAPNALDCCRPQEARPIDTVINIDTPASTSTTTSAWLEEGYPAPSWLTVPSHQRSPLPATPTPTLTQSSSHPHALTPTLTQSSSYPHALTPVYKPCVTTFTSHNFSPLNVHATVTVYRTTITLPRWVHCGVCKLAITTVDLGNGPPVITPMPTVTEGTTIERRATCSPVIL